MYGRTVFDKSEDLTLTLRHLHLFLCLCQIQLAVCVCKDLRGDPQLMAVFIDDYLRIDNISRLWEDFNRALNDKNAAINNTLARSSISV